MPRGKRLINKEDRNKSERLWECVRLALTVYMIYLWGFSFTAVS